MIKMTTVLFIFQLAFSGDFVDLSTYSRPHPQAICTPKPKASVEALFKPIVTFDNPSEACIVSDWLTDPPSKTTPQARDLQSIYHGNLQSISGS
jgi:hypothetical protein